MTLLLGAALPALLLLAAILLFVEASETFGESKEGSVTLIDVSGTVGPFLGKAVSFNEDQKLDVVIDKVLLYYAEGCAVSCLWKGGPGEKFVKAVVAPMNNCGFTPFSAIVEGRLLNGEGRFYNKNFSMHNVAINGKPR